MNTQYPSWLDPNPWLDIARHATKAQVQAALTADEKGPAQLAALLSPCAGLSLETLARRARALTVRHFGKTIALYVPLYLSNLCLGGCAYCGFASDRAIPRRRLEKDESIREMEALRRLGFDDVLLLTGERAPQADFDYLLGNVLLAARRFHHVGIEAFAMSEAEYADVARTGCASVTLYQETYVPPLYHELHRWGPKRNYHDRLEAPERALSAGIRSVGIGALLGLGDPACDLISLFLHVERLKRQFWKSGVMVSFPRICPEAGGFSPSYAVSERFLAQAIFAFRLCLPDIPLVLSTRERPAFRDGMAGVGVCRMSAASRTTVGGYGSAREEGSPAALQPAEGQFNVQDARSVEAFCRALRDNGLEPVFKNWDSALNECQGGDS